MVHDHLPVRDSLEDGEGEAGLSDGVPAPLHQVLELGGPQLPEEQLPHQLPRQDHQDERLRARRQALCAIGQLLSRIVLDILKLLSRILLHILQLVSENGVITSPEPHGLPYL